MREGWGGIVAVVLALFFLTGCTQQDLLKKVGEVQAYAAKACGFIPSIPMLGMVIEQYYPGSQIALVTVAEVGNRACSLYLASKVQTLVQDPNAIKVEGWVVK